MVVLATFNVGDLSPYVEDNFEDPLDLRANPLEEGEVDVEQGIVKSSYNQIITKALIKPRRFKVIMHWLLKSKPCSPSLV